jgi:hypothetical protein
MTTSLTRKMYDVNKTWFDTSIGTTRQVLSVVGDGVSKAAGVLRDTGATVVGQTRSAVERTVDQASSGVNEVVGQTRSAVGRTVDQASSGVNEVSGQTRAQGARATEQLDEVADRTARRATEVIDPKPSTGTPYEEWTKAELYERAQELDIDGRSTMSKDELVAALRAA